MPASGAGGARAGSASGSPQLPVLAVTLTALVVAAGYFHTLGYPFHFDDFDWIRDNLALAPPLDLAAIWDFRPSRFLADLSFALNRLTTGDSPASYRATNLVIHGLAALAVGWIAGELAHAAAGCFGRRTRAVASHPIHGWTRAAKPLARVAAARLRPRRSVSSPHCCSQPIPSPRSR